MYNPHEDPLFCFFVKGQDEIDLKYPYSKDQDKIEIAGVDRTAIINLIRSGGTFTEQKESTKEPKFLDPKNNPNILKILNLFGIYNNEKKGISKEFKEESGNQEESESETRSTFQSLSSMKKEEEEGEKSEITLRTKSIPRTTVDSLSQSTNVFETFASFGVFVIQLQTAKKRYFVSFLPKYIGYYYLGNLNEDQITKFAKETFDLYQTNNQYLGGLMTVDNFVTILEKERIENALNTEQIQDLKEYEFYVLVQPIEEKTKGFIEKYLNFLLRNVVVEILMRVYKIQNYGPTKKSTEKKKLTAEENKMKDRLINAKSIFDKRGGKFDKILLDIKKNIPVIELIEVEAENTEIYGNIPLNRGSKSMQTVVTSFVQLQDALKKCSLTQECTDAKISGPLDFTKIRSSEEKMKAEENNNNNRMMQLLDTFNCNTDPSETIQKLQDAANYYKVPVPSDRDLQSCNTLKKNIQANMNAKKN